MKHRLLFITLFIFFGGSCFTACTEKISNPAVQDEHPPVIPDYIGVTIPEGIAPLNFTIDAAFDKIHAVIKGNKSGESIDIQSKSSIQIPIRPWHDLLSGNIGNEISITVSVKQNGKWKQYAPFPIYISEYPIDYGLTYRLIAPGYELFSKMGIYERRLSDFRQKALIENTLVPGSCINCHSFKGTSSDYLSLHIRGQHGGTLLQVEGHEDLLNLRTDETISAGVYPCWHPSGKYIAYSNNTTKQAFHVVPDERIEVFDMASDIIVYNIENNEILHDPLLKSTNFETFPAFSPDGNKLYFCCSSFQEMPDDYKEVKYNLYSIDFDPSTGSFGDKIDTLIQADSMNKSVSFPRLSHDGRFLIYTLSNYGNFSIWHKEADLWLLDLTTGKTRPLDNINSQYSESYHSWSSNSRWLVFSSRRDDGLYTRLYLTSIDEKGNATKPFLLPQQKPSIYDLSFFSYNIPEFVSDPVKLKLPLIEKKILSSERKQARWRIP
jgi:hypothetical protein